MGWVWIKADQGNPSFELSTCCGCALLAILRAQLIVQDITIGRYMASVEYWQDHVAVRQQGVKKVETNSSADADES